MALIKCPECGKEVSDKSPICIYCGFPLKEELNPEEVKKFLEKKGVQLSRDINDTPVSDKIQETDYGEKKDDSGIEETNNHQSADVKSQTQLEHIGKNQKKTFGIFIAVVAVIVIIVILVSTVQKTRNAFSKYVDMIGESYKEIPGEYEVTYLSDDLAIAHVSPVEIWDVPGEIQYMVQYDEDIQDYGVVDIVSWTSTNENLLTNQEVETFIDNMINVYGEYDTKQFQEAEYWFSTDETMYWWESPSKYNIKMMVYEDMSEISIAFQRK